MIVASDHTGLVWMVYHQLRVTKRPHIDRVAIVAAGMHSLVRAANRWDENHASGATFATFAYRCISRDMRKAARFEVNHWSMIPSHSRRRGPRRLVTFSSIGDDFTHGSASVFARDDDSVWEFDFRELFARHIEPELRTLDARSRAIVEMRSLTSPAVTYEEIGKQFGIMRERVRQIEAKAMLKIRESVSETDRELLRRAVR